MSGGLIMAVALLAIAGIGLFSAARVRADSLRPSGDERLITLHDDGEDKSFLTRETTLKDALKGAGIRVDQSDMVEPALNSQLIASNYDVNIYRARPVTIIDGETRQRVMTPYRTAKQIVQQANIVLHDEDKLAMSMDSNLIQDGSSVQLNIGRATPFSFNLYGKTFQAYTQAKTVADLLREKNIKLGPNDGVSLPTNAPITAGMSLQVWRNGVQTITQEQDVAFSTRQVQDTNQPVGYKQVQTPGTAGKEEVTYQINMQNGIEVSRTVIQTVVTQQPSEQVEVIGTKVLLPPGSHTDWMSAAGISSGDYGYVDYIITHESNWNPASASSNGYYGLGQTNLNSISSACPSWRSDPICQLRYFTGYADGRYGSWEAAYNFKSAHGWW